VLGRHGRTLATGNPELGDPDEIVDNLVTNSNTDELKVHITVG
jgi:hypothetical protein